MKAARLFLPILFILSLTTFSAAAQSDPCEAGSRQISHAYGEVCIPENPQNVVSLDIAIFELMLVTDIHPAVKSDLLIQSVYQEAHPELMEEITALTADLPDLGFPVNFEIIAQAQPDLIIGADDVITEDVYALVSEIAPTFVLSVEPGDWRERILQAGEALNIADQVDALLTDYAAREDEFRAAVGEDIGEIEVSLVRAFPGQIGIMLTGSISDRVVRDLGLSRPEAQTRDLQFVLDELGGRAELLIAQEDLQRAEGDVVLVFGDSSALFTDPLWEALDSVRAGNVYEVGYYWYSDGLISAHDMLDDLFSIVAQTEPTLPNPFKDGL